MSDIEDKVVVITGASSGIGEAIAELLAADGAKLVLGARRPEPLRAVAERIAAAGGDVAYAATDVKRRDDVQALVDLALQRHGKLDVIVNNAGAMPISPMDDLRVEDWEQMVDVNIKGVLYGIAAALPVFRRQGFGHIVNMASTSAHRIVPTMAVYAGTKFAVRAISEGLRQEAGDKLRVTVISPGFTVTNFTDHVTNPEAKAHLTRMRDTVAMPADAVAHAVAYAIAQPPGVDVGEIVIRSTAAG
ncbi:MAG: SDR family oxidoreductase [Rhodospirillaceae bacterium]|nr:SDR family oxidoreductase [Rhodospirillaceae bacterium]